MAARTIMVQGTASDSGKSFTVAAICRILARSGHSVAPFKAQNMALNSAVTADGAEIGRAQAVQAEAAKTAALSAMNPILLKPKSDTVSQVIVRGKPYGDMDAKQYYEFVASGKAEEIVVQALSELSDRYDYIVIEGAGSPAEVNLHAVDIVNMRTAILAQAPVLLVGDIDRGGVFASIVGTLELLPENERNLIKGFLINKFRGDISILMPGLDFLEAKTGKPVLGVIPYFTQFRLPEEDSLASVGQPKAGVTNQVSGMADIAVILLPRISNFTDFDALAAEPGVSLRYVRHAEDFGNPDAVIIPGTKNTLDDLLHIRESGIEALIKEHHQRGGIVCGICGGYQMLGNVLHDPEHLESDIGDVQGIGILDAETVFLPGKETHLVRAEARYLQGCWKRLAGEDLAGYEIHSGATCVGARAASLFSIIERRGADAGGIAEGALSEDGRVFGTYLHGIFDNSSFREMLHGLILGARPLHPMKNMMLLSEPKIDVYELLADGFQAAIDLDMLQRIIREGV